MLKLNPAPGAQTNYEVIDQFFAAQLAANESEETLNSLRPKAEAAIQASLPNEGSYQQNATKRKRIRKKEAKKELIKEKK